MAVDDGYQNPQLAKKYMAEVCYLCNVSVMGGQEVGVYEGYRVHARCIPRPCRKCEMFTTVLRAAEDKIANLEHELTEVHQALAAGSADQQFDKGAGL